MFHRRHQKRIVWLDHTNNSIRKKNIVHFWESQRLDAEDALMVEAGISGDSRTV